jgi:uncharacterized protein YjiS (DUF1127 family)
MTQLSLHGEYRPFSLDRRGDERRGPARPALAVRASSLRTFDPVAQYGLRRGASLGVSRRADTRHIAVPTGIRRIMAAIRLWRGRARSRQQLRGLNNHLLRDIGLRREDVGYEFPKPFWHD